MKQLVSRRRVMIGTMSAAAGLSLMSSLPRLGAAQEASPAASPAAAGTAFPVTIAHAYGETTLETAPLRVVSVGWSSYDSLISLGTIPVAQQRFDWGGDADGFLPWTREAIGDAELPLVYDATEIPFEIIAGANPDLILGVYSGITDTEYETLSGIAPTIAYPEVSWGTSWQDVHTVTGQALGKPDEAAAKIAEIEALIASQVEQYPQLAGKTFAYGTVGASEFGVYTVSDARSRFLSAIGLEPSDFVKNLDSNEWTVQVSFELAGTIESDIFISWFSTQEEVDAALALPTFQSIPAVANGAFAPIIGQDVVMASSAFSVLSIPYMLEAFIPTLAAAADAADAAAG